MATAPPPQGGSQGGGGKLGFLKQKLGFQPTWAWMAEILGLALAYALYKDRKAASTASTSSTTSSNGEVPADQVPDVIIQNDLQGPSTTGPTTTPTPVTSTVPPSVPAPAPKSTGTIKVPDLVGARANFGIGQLESLGLAWTSTTGDRNPQNEYTISSQNPKAGTMVAKGTKVSVGFKQIK
jgi:hypothetical protein